MALLLASDILVLQLSKPKAFFKPFREFPFLPFFLPLLLFSSCCSFSYSLLRLESLQLCLLLRCHCGGFARSSSIALISALWAGSTAQSQKNKLLAGPRRCILFGMWAIFTLPLKGASPFVVWWVGENFGFISVNAIFGCWTCAVVLST